MNVQDRIRAKMPEVIARLRASADEHAPDTRPAMRGLEIVNRAGDTATVRIYDEIWTFGVNAADVRAELDTITAPRIVVEINSPGGDVFDGITIYNALRNHPATVVTQVDGIAASIASVIFQAGDERVMQPAGQLMIHNAWGMAAGDATDHADMAVLLERQDGIIADIYAKASGRDAAEFRELMNAETWITAGRAVELGLADSVLEDDDDQNGPQNKATLVDEISHARTVVAAVCEAAETVVAVRAEAGKTLSNVAVESLDGLRGEVERLVSLTSTEPPTPEATGDGPATDGGNDAAALLLKSAALLHL